MEYLHFHSQGGGRGCQNWAIPSVPFPGLGNSTRRQAGGSASLPGVSLRARHFTGSQLLFGVAYVLWPILQMRKLRLKQRKQQATGAQPGSCRGSALNCLGS